MECEILTVARQDCDLRRQTEVERWLARARPEVVVVAAAKVGGILANAASPAEFLYDNLMIEANVIQAARRVGVAKLLFLGSSCIYPKFAPQPISEELLLEGQLEPTNQWYAWPRSPGSSCARPTAASTAATSSARCRPTCTARATTSTFDQPCGAGADRQDARSQGGRRARGRDLGHRSAAARVPARRRSGRRLRASARALQRREPRSTSAAAPI